MKIHKVSGEVTEDLFNFYQTILPYGDRGKLIPKLLTDLRSIHKADPSIIRKYIEGKITILDFKQELTNGTSD